MIDVGAHIGGSLIRFALDRWKIFAFEQDDKKRSKLIHFCNSVGLNNINIDKRVVPDISEKDLIFYQSDISSVISGLSVFHTCHK